jgi:hypothetical protein
MIRAPKFRIPLSGIPPATFLPPRREEDNMKAKSLEIEIGMSERERVLATLLAIFSPFGSLTEGVDGPALAGSILDFFESQKEDRPRFAGEILRHVWSATTDQQSTVFVDRWGVVVTTPTSGTKISIRNRGGTDYWIIVDFAGESSTRLSKILLTAEMAKAGILFNVWSPDGDQIKRKAYLDWILDGARKNLAWLEGLDELYYTGDRKTELLVQARNEVDILEEVVSKNYY